MKKRYLIIGAICICIAVILFLIWYQRTHEFYYFFTSNKYMIKQSDTNKTISFTVDLTNPEDEIGKKIVITDNCYFEIIDLKLQNNGQYTILFKNYGNKSSNPKFIYTANYYDFQDDKVYIKGKANLTSNEDEKWYRSSWTSFQDNGDSFGYNIESDMVKNKENCFIEISNLNYVEFVKG